MRRLVPVFGVVLACSLAACGGGPCPRGQELRQETDAQKKLKARGCVGRDAEGNDLLQGRWEFFYPGGQKQAEGQYKNARASGERADAGFLKAGRDGHWVFWHENGQKSLEISYRDGKREGTIVEWFESGKKQREGTYRNDELLAGTLKRWDDKGNRVQ